MNTHESYVSLETAKLLKENGFDWEVYRCYETLPEKKKIFGRHLVPYQGKAREDVLPAPTLAVAQRWLREVKYVEVEICWEIGDILDFGDRRYLYHIESDVFKDSNDGYDSYEEALEVGVKKALEMIAKERRAWI